MAKQFFQLKNLKIAFVPEGSTENILANYKAEGLQIGAIGLEQEDVTSILLDEDIPEGATRIAETVAVVAKAEEIEIPGSYSADVGAPGIPEADDDSLISGPMGTFYAATKSEKVFYSCGANFAGFGEMTGEAQRIAKTGIRLQPSGWVRTGFGANADVTFPGDETP